MGDYEWEKAEDLSKRSWIRFSVISAVILALLTVGFFLGRVTSERSPAAQSETNVIPVRTSSPSQSASSDSPTTLDEIRATTTSSVAFAPPNDVAHEMLDAVNLARSTEGLDLLTWCPALASAAQAHSESMDSEQFFDHDSPDGSTSADRARQSGYDYQGLGENIAVGQMSVGEVMRAWMDSPGHRANILNADFTHFGLGMFRGQFEGFDSIYWTQNFGFGGECD